MSRALVLLSGGVDSSVCLFLAAKEHGLEAVLAVTFDWGQLAWPQEREASLAVARAAGLEPPTFVSIKFPYGGILTGGERQIHIKVPDPLCESFFPARNLVLLSYAFGIAFVQRADAIYFGPGAADQPGYPDCRPGFVMAMEEAGNEALGAPRISLLAPLIGMPKARIVEMGRELGVPLESTFSCYTPVEGAHCGACGACLERSRAGL